MNYHDIEPGFEQDTVFYYLKEKWPGFKWRPVVPPGHNGDLDFESDFGLCLSLDCYSPHYDVDVEYCVWVSWVAEPFGVIFEFDHEDLNWEDAIDAAMVKTIPRFKQHLKDLVGSIDYTCEALQDITGCHGN